VWMERFSEDPGGRIYKYIGGFYELSQIVAPDLRLYP